MRIVSRELINLLLVLAGAFSAGFGVKGFLLSSHFIDGGVTGVSMLLGEGTGLPLALLIPIINLPFIYLGYRQVGLPFALRSMFGIGVLATILATVRYPDVTPDLVLTAVFGGFFIGAGIGLAIRGGAVLDGTEVAALVVSRRSGLLRVSDVILALNVVIFGAALFILGVEESLYSVLTYFTASKTIDFILHGLEEYTSLTIVSERHAAIRAGITRTLGRGVTVLKGEGGASGSPLDVIYCVVTRLEIGKVRTVVRNIDPTAFVVVQGLSEAEGGVLRHRMPVDGRAPTASDPITAG
jgi:uncharacterized membrane-anchored protein YitT (DUF2179 family)